MTGDVKRILLFLPNLDGHRQIYCRELCDYFLSRDLSVTVATRLAGLQKYEQLSKLREHPDVRFIADPCAGETDPSKKLRRLSGAGREIAVDLTFLAEADNERALLSAQIIRPRKRLPGRRVGLFIRSTNYVHEIRYPKTGRIPTALVKAWTYRPISLTQRRIFHEVVMKRFPILDAALCLDEVFAAKQGGRYGWLPDIAAASADDRADSAETAAWQMEICAFLAAQRESLTVVYVGTAQSRRGYGVLLRLARDVGGCFVHCGEPPGQGGDPDDDSGARAALASRSAILEFGRFYQCFDTAQATFGAARCVVLPYDDHLGSSGVMLQALMAGRPVLVPDQGLMAWRVRNFGLGLTFAPGNWRDMRHKFAVLQNTPAEVFSGPIARYLEYFTKSQFEAAMDVALGLSQNGPRIPSAGESG
jgi:glycosyltransferase involved in cell wall biosynthesis